MSGPISDVAQAILLHGSPTAGERLRRDSAFRAADVKPGTFRAAASGIGSKKGSPGLAFFDSTQAGRIAFGPGAGLAVGVSVGAEQIRAVLVDANGWEYHQEESPPLENQLAAEPTAVLNRIRATVSTVLQKTFDQSSELLIEGALPLLGCAVAWPTPVDRQRKAVGHALAHDGWRSGTPLDQRVADAIDIDGFHTYALNDAHAAAIAVAHRETHKKEHLAWGHPLLSIVLRLAGNIGAGVIVLEPPEVDKETGRKKSGFLKSTLIAGVDNHAGEIGHAQIAPSTITALNEKLPDRLAELTAQRCSCTSKDDPNPPHLEAYAAVLALTKRVNPMVERREALATILTNPSEEPNKRALADVGSLVAEALTAPVAVLNPANIVVTGSLALPEVCKGIKERVKSENKFGTAATVTTIPDKDNDYLRAKGAALALIRNRVHREIDKLLGSNKEEVQVNVAELTTLLSENPL
ncbi:MAG: ROK family protein [Solirubrobacteraceae bacterium]